MVNTVTGQYESQTLMIWSLYSGDLKMWAHVKSFYGRHRLGCSMAMYCTLWGAGDYTRQAIHHVHPREHKHAAKMSTVGGFVIAPISYNWYRFLDGFIPGINGVSILKKVVLDQCVLSLVGLCCFYTAMSILEGKEDIFAELRKKGLLTWKTGVCYWPVMQTINFRLVSPRYRLVFLGFASYVWTIILSFYQVTDFEEKDNKEEIYPGPTT